MSNRDWQAHNRSKVAECGCDVRTSKQPNIQFQQFSDITPTDAWVCPEHVRGALTNSAGERFQYEYRQFLSSDRYAHATSTRAVTANLTFNPFTPSRGHVFYVQQAMFPLFNDNSWFKLQFKQEWNGTHIFSITFFDVIAYLICFNVPLMFNYCRYKSIIAKLIVPK
jgi:hypothetical protein